MTQNTSDGRAGSGAGWVVVLAGLGVNLVLGVLYAWGVMKAALKVQWHWTDTQAAMPFSVATAAFALMMIFAGRLQDKIGPRWVAMVGGLTLGLGLLASGFTESPTLILLTFGVVGGLGIGLGYSATTPAAIKWFPPARKGLITGIVVAGVGLAAVWIGPLVQFLLGDKNDIAQTFMVLGGGTIIAVCVLAQWLKNPPAGYVAGRAGAGPKKAARGKREVDWREMLGTGQFYLLWVMFILAASAGLMIIAHAATIGKEQASLKWGFMPIVLLAVFNTAGRVLSGYVSDAIGRPRTMLLAFLLQAANMFVFRYYTTPELVLFGASFTGLCYGTIFTLFPATAADFYGVKNLGVNYGILFTAFGAAGVVGPILGGQVHDRTGSYQMSYWITGAMLVVAALLTFVAKAPRLAPVEMVPEQEGVKAGA